MIFLQELIFIQNYSNLTLSEDSKVEHWLKQIKTDDIFLQKGLTDLEPKKEEVTAVTQ
jgi:hypothetical protein